MVETRNPTIERAIEIVTAEIELTEEERRAFKSLLSRLRDIDPSGKQPAAESPPTHEPILAITDHHRSERRQNRPNTSQQRVIDAYRETIVQLDHYEEEYGNPIHQDIVLEFGEQVAHAVFAPGPLSSMAFRLLVAQAKESLEERTQHARELDREHDSLERFDADLSEIETRFAECPVPSEVAAESVPTIRDELLELERNCERLIDRRQDMLHSRSTTDLRGLGELSFNTYVYGERLSVSCPVLHDAVTLLRDIRAERGCCEETLPQSAIQEPR